MSVLIETSADLLVVDSPKICLNFLKLCKVKYYNYSLFHSIRQGYTVQTGDPHFPNGNGGTSIWGLISSDKDKKFFLADKNENHRHDKKGTVAMVTARGSSDKEQLCGSQFIITLGDEISQLDGETAIFGHVVEGFDSLEKINSAYCDPSGRPLRDIRIKHTYILEDPFDDPQGLKEPPASPEPTEDQLASARIGDEEEIEEDQENEERKRADQKARQQALTLEMVGDLPSADVKPKENQLFVCKVNPITEDEDLELIFSRFGKIVSCEIVRDKKTGESLQYGFIDFERKEDCERAYAKMEGVLIDDRRIHVDFSQSVSRLQEQARTESKRKQSRHGSTPGDRYRDDRSADRTYKDNHRSLYRSGHREQGRSDRDEYRESDRRRKRDGSRERDRREREDRDGYREPERRRDRDGYRESSPGHRRGSSSRYGTNSRRQGEEYRDHQESDSRRYRERY